MVWECILRLFVAAVLGGLVGLDREYRAKEAGLRTHFLVGMGSALFMVISMYGFGEEHSGDPGRIAAQVVTGIGFIGAGSIMINKQFVRGLTTASGLWATAGIGLAVGAGMYWIGIVAMVLTIIGLELSTFLFRSIGIHTSLLVFSTTHNNNLTTVLSEIHKKGYTLVSYEATHEAVGDGELFRVTMAVKTRSHTDDTHLFQFIQSLPDLTIEKME